jgi:hypothetical protein
VTLKIPNAPSPTIFEVGLSPTGEWIGDEAKQENQIHFFIHLQLKQVFLAAKYSEGTSFDHIIFS